MTDLDRIHAKRVEVDRAKTLLDAYDTVRAHITPTLNPGSITMSVLDNQRAVIDSQIDRALAEIRTIRAACSHAWELVGGGSRSPFWSCVLCQSCAFDNPVPGATW